MNISKVQLRFLGFAGILGGLLLFTGDMLFYFDNASTSLILNMGNSSDLRIQINGVIALFATWLYLLGLGQVYIAFKPAKRNLRNIVIITFAGILISYGIIHAAYIAIATTAKLAVQNSFDIETATALASATNNTIRMIIYPVFAILSFIFIWQVWKKNTLYPRLMIIFFPFIPFLLHKPISSMLSGSAWIVVSGGYYNLMLVLFFTASTIMLWNFDNR